MPAAMFVMSEKPRTSMPDCRAAIASSAVDMPTMWPPIDLRHPHLGRRLVLRPAELAVHALVERRIDRAGEVAQPHRVEVGEVDEGRALER